jgi:hypothetical protein
MKKILLIVVFLQLSGHLLAAPEAEADSSQTEQPVTHQPKPPAGIAVPAAKPAKNFTPSEKVGADSAVSFPVDI